MTETVEAVYQAVKAERERCINLICVDCAAGVPVENDGSHILETIQGHAAHIRQCPAHVLRIDQ
jgi:hypothetical protein